MKRLPLTLAILFVVTVALSAFSYAPRTADSMQAAPSAVSAQNQETLAKLQALSIHLQTLPREERVAFAREAATELGYRFLEPNSVEGRTLINKTVARRIVQIYASDLPLEEKRQQARGWAEDAGAQIGFVPATEPLAPQSARKHPKKPRIESGGCTGRCANMTILEGSGCVLSCQQWACDLEFFYIECSQTWIICAGNFHDFGWNCAESCPCAQ